MDKKNHQPKRVAILTYPDLCTFEFGCAVELFSLERPEISKYYETDIVSIQKRSVKATGGVSVETDLVFTPNCNNDYFNKYNMLVVAGWTDQQTKPSDELLSSLCNFYHNGGTLVSFCGGAFVLASTGLLDGKPATTHWLFIEALREQFPNIQFYENILYTKGDRIYTSAGSAAGIDLGLYLICKDFGAHVANKIAKRLVISAKREGGQAQYAKDSSIPNQPSNIDSSISWAKENLHNKITIDEMAKKACLSRRSFDRYFQKNLQQSPKVWLIKQRINLARILLETTQHHIEKIAEDSGFGSSMSLRLHFRKNLSVSPSYYRKQFFHDQEK